MEEIIEKFSDLTAKPVNFLAIQNDIKGEIKNLVKTLYDFTKAEESKTQKKKGCTLSEMIIEEFDEEQIWQQIELQNTECWDHLVWNVANCMSNKNDLLFPVEIEAQKPESSNEEVESIELEDFESANNEAPAVNIKVKNGIRKLKASNKISSIVDDQFFKLKDMEQFLISEEKIKEKGTKKDDDEESIDLFEDIDDDDSEDDQGIKYKDFFNDDANDEIDAENEDSENSNVEDNFIEQDDDRDEETHSDTNKNRPHPNITDKKVRFAGLEPENGSECEPDDIVSEKSKVFNKDNDVKKSDFELRQQRLQQKISKLEEKTLKEAPWQLKGEVDATKRPQNSLLEEIVDFDLTTRPAPIITEQTTITLEGLIRQRIKDKAWDDVVKKEKPIDDQLAFKKLEILDHSKSKLSLAQVYEAEYLKQKQANSGDNQEEDEPESHKEIRETMSKLFLKLDALCHYHYTPKAPQPEVKIVSNTPAISMEEVAPVATSDATLLAPEEIKRKQKGDLMSKEERSQTDKKRERRKKKKIQKLKGNIMKVTDHRNTKKGLEANDKSLKTSKAFFQQLNDDTSSLIKKNKNKNK